MRNVPLVLVAVLLWALPPVACWSGTNLSNATGPQAAPYVIDDFSGTVVDPAKWSVSISRAGEDLFSLSGGRLSFSVTAGSGVLQSTRSFGPGFYTMRFLDFTSTNEEPPGSHKGAFVGLGLGPRDNFVRMIRCQNGHRAGRRGESPYVGVFEANYIDKLKGGIQVYYVRTETKSGRLGLHYDGSKVTFYFNSSLDGDAGWQTMKRGSGVALQWDPHWTQAPSLFIAGFDPSGITSFKVDNVEYRPSPPKAK
jgi:hypothetical protein